MRGGAWSSAGSTTAGSKSESGLTEATLYEYRLRVQNASGMSAYSDVVGAYTLPAAPSGLSITPPTSQNAEYGTLDLDWTDNSNGETDQIIEASVNGGPWHEYARVGANTIHHTLDYLACGATYQFRIVAENQSGPSTPSNVASQTLAACGWMTYGEALVTQPSSSTHQIVLKTPRAEEVTEPSGIHGASIRLAPGNYTVNATLDLHTWDSYNEYQGGGTGYYDPFSISFTDRPYWELSLQDPIQDSLPSGSFVWGGQGYDDGSEETRSGTATVSVNSPDAPVYLNVILRTDGVDPSWGTIVLAAAVGAAPIVGHAKPMVAVDATVDQAAEGGSPGEFTFYRYSNDTSQALTVNYSVGGSATAGTDYTTLSGSVTIPAGSSFATVNVSALTDAVAGEGVETVTLSILPDANLYNVNPTSSQDTVQLLNKAKYLVAFYGAGSPGLFGNVWLESIANRAVSDHDYDHLIMRQQDQGGAALSDLFSYLNADGDSTISRAEAESADLRVLGYSWGGIQAINFTWHLNRKGKRVHGYKLAEVIDVQKLVTIDPVNNKQPFKTARTIQPNVKQHASYFQRKRGRSTIRYVDPNTGQVTAYGEDMSNWFSRGLRGNDLAANAKQVEVDFATIPVERLHRFPNGTIGNGRLYGNDVNHDTMPWFLHDIAIGDLQ